MKRYFFELLKADHPNFEEKGHVIFSDTLEKAVQKFERMHDVDAPAYWDEPHYDTWIEMDFKDEQGMIRYRITWESKM
jgi:hypothetical protein